MQASTLEILEAADFSPKQARALAQAIEGEVKGSDLVTRPIFDAGLAELKLELARLEIRLFNKMVGVGMTGIGVALTGVYFLVLNLKR